MTLGEKIRDLRKRRNMTQSELSSDVITRNMLSEIECDKASPSIATLKYIASRLGASPSYFLSEDDDLLFFEKKKVLEKIKSAYSKENFSECISLISLLPSHDDELCYILAKCHFALGRKAVLGGSLITAKKHLVEAEKYAYSTIYDTDEIKNLLLMYKALSENIQSPLLEFDVKQFENGIDPNFELEFYKYICSEYDYKFKNPIFQKHSEAKEHIKNRDYHKAISLLEEITNEKNPKTYNSYVMFSVYTDMEYCSKQLANFEAAYKYASKRLSMLEGFKT